MKPYKEGLWTLNNRRVILVWKGLFGFMFCEFNNGKKQQPIKSLDELEHGKWMPATFLVPPYIPRKYIVQPSPVLKEFFSKGA